MKNKKILIEVITITIFFFLFSLIFVNISDFKLEFGFPIIFLRVTFSDSIIYPIDYLKRTSVDMLSLLLNILIYKYLYLMIYTFIRKIRNKDI